MNEAFQTPLPPPLVQTLKTAWLPSHSGSLEVFFSGQSDGQSTASAYMGSWAAVSSVVTIYRPLRGLVQVPVFR